MRYSYFQIVPFLLLIFVLGGCQNQMISEQDKEVVSEQKMTAVPERIRYELSDDGVLEIWGTGELKCSDLSFCEERNLDIIDRIKKIIIHEGITEIGDEFFSFYESLEMVDLPTGLKKIDKSAFYYSYMLKDVHIPDTVEEIGNYAFADCSSLKELTLPSSLNKYKTNAISGCYSIRKLVNRSSQTRKLCKEGLHGTWYCADKKVDKIKPGQEVHLKSDQYKIVYDLNGGKAQAKLPEYYTYRDGADLPDTVQRKGYSFAGWLTDTDICNYIMSESKGTMKVTAVWINFQVENLKGGMIRAFWYLDMFSHEKNETYYCMIRYSKNKDMSDFNFIRTAVEDTDVIIKKLEKGERYYIEYAIIDDLDGWETIADLPWQGKTSIKI